MGPLVGLLLLCVMGMNSSLAQLSVLECETDQDCIDVYGMGNYCCARVNSIIRDLRQCKPIGQEGELCHVGSNYLPYPFRGARRFWRCQCNFPQGFWCAPDSTSSLRNGGRCERWVPPANTTGAPPANTTGVPPASTTWVPPANITGVPPANTTGVPPANTTISTEDAGSG